MTDEQWRTCQFHQECLLSRLDDVVCLLTQIRDLLKKPPTVTMHQQPVPVDGPAPWVPTSVPATSY